MKKAIIILLIAMSVFSTESFSQNEAIDAIMKRTSVRSYTSEPVSEEEREILLRAAMAAPTARNTQPWEFIVLTDPDVIQPVFEAIGQNPDYQEIPLAILVCGNKEKALEGPTSEYWVQDCSAATQNILVAAASLNLSTLWIGGYPNMKRMEPVAKILSLPEHIIPMSVILVGHSKEEPKPKNKFKKENIHYNKW